MTTMTITPTLLTDDMLERFGSRAAVYDRENRFFTEDFEELRDAGYLKMPIPRELGGLGMTLAEVAQEQRRLAYRAPATALATNMHLYWMGIARDLWVSGDKSLEWILREGAEGEVFAAGHAEVGNDLPGLLSTSTAERVEGGWKINGRKMFGSLGPAWTRIGIHAMDATDPAGPRVIHAFVPRTTPGLSTIETWDTLGMRATRSDDTLLKDVFVADQYVGRILPAGEADQFILSLFGWALLNMANIYYAIALRARDLAIAGAKKKTSIAVSRSMAYHPEFQHDAAEITIEIEGMGPHIDRIAQEWSDGVDHGHEWPSKLVVAKYHMVESAKRVVDLAMELSGGAGMFKTNELERLYRDVRCGGFHPANSALTHELVGKTALGVGLEEQPRWG
jgi:alkylation response protein AidB-like acyl-CoA dehydrogenase